MGFADLLEQVGSTGRFQVAHVTLLMLPILMMASHNLLQNFVAAMPPHHCSAHRNLSLSPLSPLDIRLITIPLDADGRPESCRRYAAPQWHLLPRNGTSGPPEEWGEDPGEGSEAAQQGCTDGWAYNSTEGTTTIISEWDLVCDRRPLKRMGQTIYMGGVLVGALVFGSLSDRYGRRLLLIFSYLLISVAGTCTAFSTSFSLYCLFRFLCGMAVSGMVLNSSSLILEWIPTHVRTVVGTGTGYFYTLGQLFLAGVAYLIRDWRSLMLAVSLPYFVAFLYSWWFIESSRWLILTKQPEQAVKNLKTVARFNGRYEEGEKINAEVLQEAMKKEMSFSDSTYTSLDLFRTRTMRDITMFLSAVWFSVSFAYYGLSMDLQKFGVNIYLMQVIFGAVDIPAKLIINVTMSLYGRRRSQSGGLILAGVIVLANQLVSNDKQIVRTCLVVLGKGCLAASFNCCYLYSGELYPTVLRQSGMGWVSMMARLGSMVAPMVLIVGDYVEWLPGVIFGVVPILSGLAAIFLPETVGSPLPDTMQDVEERASGRSSKMPPEKKALSLGDTQDIMLNHAA